MSALRTIWLIRFVPTADIRQYACSTPSKRGLAFLYGLCRSRWQRKIASGKGYTPATGVSNRTLQPARQGLRSLWTR